MQIPINVLNISKKQAEYIRNANHRWNFKLGATQCGKTYVDTLYVIPNGILERRGKAGLNFIVGVSKGTIQRNIIEPMQEIFGINMVSNIGSNNIATIFGEKVYCLGADNVSAVRRFRGARIKFLYIDEVVDIVQEVFELLKSRLSFEYSIAHASGNPQSSNHYIKKFIESDADVYVQYYTLFDNPFLPKEYIKQLCIEYEGTIFYNRYILGEWCNAEGLIYRLFADNTEEFLVDKVSEKLLFISFGIDYGAGKSKIKFVATGITYNFRNIYILDEYDLTEIYDPDQIYEHFIFFYNRVYDEYGMGQYCFPDYGALGNVITLGLIRRCQREHLPVNIKDCIKGEINDRIFLSSTLFAQRRLKILRKNKVIVKAFKDAVWNKKKEDERLDDGTTDIDSLDAFEYSINSFYENLINSRR